MRSDPDPATAQANPPSGCATLLIASGAGSAAGTAATLALIVALSSTWRDSLHLFLALPLLGMAVFSLGCLATFFATILWGIPVMTVLREEKAESLGGYVLAGALGGFLLDLLFDSRNGPEVAIYLAYGTATGAAFWRFYRRAAVKEEADRSARLAGAGSPS